ncbi:tRNA 2-selenouridine(34) synthase MnmH [Niabella drilacis]|uniref:tRNA 2-selenouridine synthase n=1 Tax=Niabella drilacis (strain DSM 25811 / CCM 8410 / CCUG 62505 / LMG 26954 / E90) TaxID=1285928 RepID=A0A1G6WC19_NIADE|nr:tRNA 2-selenouridine(34) synthase MnmH [Niabella drilacis]SDD62615.1 tRNA 2-selenouridine synthase [Niabella drilacis]
MTQNITISDWIQQAQTLPLADVRTPAEFAQGHIPGAVNLPLFSNEERVQVGTTYKQVGREEAILLGFELTGTKWAGFIRQCLQIAPGKRIAVHCWRGGMRSGAMAWALGLYGFEVYQVTGGYKAYRRWAHRQFERPFNLQILGGMTGSGKTRLLQYMRQEGQQVIDLEDLAQHQGSSYGTMNRMVQPTQEQFENELAWQLKDMHQEAVLWLEDECQKIGRRSIPLPLWLRMREALLIDLQVPEEQRVVTLLQDYGHLDPDFLVEGTERIHKRLGPVQTKEAIAAIREGRMADFIRIALVYYDKAYRKGLGMRPAGKVFGLVASGNDMAADSRLLAALAASLK